MRSVSGGGKQRSHLLGEKMGVRHLLDQFLIAVLEERLLAWGESFALFTHTTFNHFSRLREIGLHDTEFPPYPIFAVLVAGLSPDRTQSRSRLDHCTTLMLQRLGIIQAVH